MLLTEARSKADAETVERARVWYEAKARDKAEITSIAAESREKVESEAEATARVKEKSINSKRVAEAGDATKIKVETKVEVRDWDVGILTDILHNVKAPLKVLKRAVVVSKEDTKEK